MLRMLGNISYDLYRKVKVKGQIIYFLVNSLVRERRAYLRRYTID